MLRAGKHKDKIKLYINNSTFVTNDFNGNPRVVVVAASVSNNVLKAQRDSGFDVLVNCAYDTLWTWNLMVTIHSVFVKNC